MSEYHNLNLESRRLAQSVGGRTSSPASVRTSSFEEVNEMPFAREGEMSNAAAKYHAPTTVGEGNYTVQQGDCLSSIAATFGFSWQTLWNLPENKQLKLTRKNPNVLQPGDKLTIPDICPQVFECSTDKEHTFVLKGTPVKFVLTFLEDSEPRAGESYVLFVEGQHSRKGVLDSKGTLKESIPPTAKSGKLILAGTDEIPLTFGNLNPVTEVSGVQGRLFNLGFSPGLSDGIWSPQTASAMAEFQKTQGLNPTGTINDATRSALVKVHGS